MTFCILMEPNLTLANAASGTRFVCDFVRGTQTVKNYFQLSTFLGYGQGLGMRFWVR